MGDFTALLKDEDIKRIKGIKTIYLTEKSKDMNNFQKEKVKENLYCRKKFNLHIKSR